MSAELAMALPLSRPAQQVAWLDRPAAVAGALPRTKTDPQADGAGSADAAPASPVSMPGLAELMRVLRNPELLFGPPSELPAGRGHEPVDWDHAPAEIQRIVLSRGGRCADVLQSIELAAQVLRAKGVRICRGAVNLVFLEHEDLLWQVCAALAIDADFEETVDLKLQCHDLEGAIGLQTDGFFFSLESGWQIDDAAWPFPDTDADRG